MLTILPYFSPLLGNGWLWAAVPLFIIASYFYFWENAPAAIYKKFFWALAVLLLIRAILRTLFQYFLWSSEAPSLYLLPPHQPIFYFLRYSLTHHFASFLLTAFFLLAIFGVFWSLKRWGKLQDRNLWAEGEEYIFLSGALLARWPLIIPYLFLGIILGTLYFIIARYIAKENLQFLNIMPFFAVLAPIFVYFSKLIIYYFSLTSLLMPL